jgi:hypothetical protein
VLRCSLAFAGMRSKGDPTFDSVAAIVLAHLIVSIVHGVAHSGAHVLLSPAATLYVLVVILAGPLIGLALMASGRQLGSWVIAAALVGSLVFGFVKHFVFPSPDHVAHVDPHWRSLFATTAALLAVTEALGCGLAIRFAIGKKS